MVALDVDALDVVLGVDSRAHVGEVGRVDDRIGVPDRQARVDDHAAPTVQQHRLGQVELGKAVPVRRQPDHARVAVGRDEDDGALGMPLEVLASRAPVVVAARRDERRLRVGRNWWTHM